MHISSVQDFSQPAMYNILPWYNDLLPRQESCEFQQADIHITQDHEENQHNTTFSTRVNKGQLCSNTLMGGYMIVLLNNGRFQAYSCHLVMKK